MAEKRTLAKLAYVSALTILVALVFLAPLSANTDRVFSEAIYSAFSKTCHQLPERSFAIAGNKLAVCARCTGIWLGLLIGTFFTIVSKNFEKNRLPGKKTLLLGISPLFFDGFSQLLGLTSSSNETRLLTGLMFGAVVSAHLFSAYDALVMGVLAEKEKKGL